MGHRTLFGALIGATTWQLSASNFILNALASVLFGGGQQDALKSEEIIVVGAGFARTGTASLYTALNILGFHSYHMKEAAIHDHSLQWKEALNANRADMAAEILLSNGYNATVDTPGCMFAVEFARMFPNGKVILTTRSDPSKWLDSVAGIARLHEAMVRPPFAFLGRVHRFNDMVVDLWESLGCPLANVTEAACLNLYHAHNARVRAEVPAEQLLDFQVSQGWEPLCRFLGVPVPDVAFPHTNDALGMRIAIMVMRALEITYYVLPILIFVFMLRVCCDRGKKSKTL